MLNSIENQSFKIDAKDHTRKIENILKRNQSETDGLTSTFMVI